MATPIVSPIELAFAPEAIDAATRIDPAALQSDFVRLPSDLAYYNGVFADAMQMLIQAKRELDIGEAQIRQEYRDKYEGASRITVDQLDTCMMADSRYREMREQVDAAEVLKSRAAGVVDAIRAKRDSLISLGHFALAEMRSPPQVRDNQGGSAEDRISALERRAGVR
jgi:hypothetical protein